MLSVVHNIAQAAAVALAEPRSETGWMAYSIPAAEAVTPASESAVAYRPVLAVVYTSALVVVQQLAVYRLVSAADILALTALLVALAADTPALAALLVAYRQAPAGPGQAAELMTGSQCRS